MEIPTYIEWKPREEVLEVVRGSLVPKSGKFFLMSLWVLLPFFLLFPLWRLGTWGGVIFFLLLLSGVATFARAYFVWVRTLFIVTDRRVIDHDQKGFFHREVTEARYDQMDEVSYHINGLLPTIFRYGTLKIQLQGASADIEAQSVPRPSHLTDVINDLRSQVRQKDHAHT